MVEGARVCHKLLSHFSFDTIGAKEKFTKENAVWRSSPLARGDKGFAPLIRALFLKKEG